MYIYFLQLCIVVDSDCQWQPCLTCDTCIILFSIYRVWCQFIDSFVINTCCLVIYGEWYMPTNLCLLYLDLWKNYIRPPTLDSQTRYNINKAKYFFYTGLKNEKQEKRIFYIVKPISPWVPAFDVWLSPPWCE